MGPADPPLLEQTIGDNLDATVARFPEREAVVDRAAGIRLTYAELGDQVDRLARALVAVGIEKGDRVGIWAPNCVEWTLTQYATAKVGAILVTINPAYRSHELAYVLNQAGIRMVVVAASFKSSDYVAMVEAARAGCPALEDVVVIGQGSWDALLARADEVSPERLTMVQAALDTRRPDQHPVHVGDHRLPQGRDPLAPQHPQQRLPRRRAVPLHRGGPDLHPGALLPLLRHGHGQPRGHHPRGLRGHPGAGLRPGRDAGRGRRGAVHLALRRADDVHRRVGTAGPRVAGPVLACAPASWPGRRARHPS